MSGMALSLTAIKKAKDCLSSTCPRSSSCFLSTTSTTSPVLRPVLPEVLRTRTRTVSPCRAVLKSEGRIRISCSLPSTMTKPIPERVTSRRPLYKSAPLRSAGRFFFLFLLFLFLLSLIIFFLKCYRTSGFLYGYFLFYACPGRFVAGGTEKLVMNLTIKSVKRGCSSHKNLGSMGRTYNGQPSSSCRNLTRCT